MQYKFKNAQNTTLLLISYVASIDMFNFSISSSVFAYSIVSHHTSYIIHLTLSLSLFFLDVFKFLPVI